MEVIFEITLFILAGYFLINWFVKQKINGFNSFYENTQENTIREANKILNLYLLEFSNKPSEELKAKILDILSLNQSYIILTFIDNKDPKDDGTFSISNSINFRKIKNGEIGAFTDFEIMRSYVGRYISTEIILIADFIKICKNKGITSISLNFTLPNPFRLRTTNE